MTTLPCGALLASALTALILTLTAPAATAANASRTDPTGDVAGDASSSQRDTVDITRVEYRLTARKLIITTQVVDLARTAGNQFVETTVLADGPDVTLVSRLGNDTVRVFTGSAFGECKGSSTEVNYRADVVEQRVPLRCIEATSFRLRSLSTVAADNGASIAQDSVRRSGRFSTISADGASGSVAG